MAAMTTRLRDWPLTAARAVNDARAELLTGIALVGGWTLVTQGIAQLTTTKVWPISVGLLLLLLCGVQWLHRVFMRGLYRLYLDEKDGGHG
jgi:hypothetical protein